MLAVVRSFHTKICHLSLTPWTDWPGCCQMSAPLPPDVPEFLTPHPQIDPRLSHPCKHTADYIIVFMGIRPHISSRWSVFSWARRVYCRRVSKQDITDWKFISRNKFTGVVSRHSPSSWLGRDVIPVYLLFHLPFLPENFIGTLCPFREILNKFIEKSRKILQL